MAKTVVYESFEVREGFGPNDVGPLQFASASRADADRVLEQMSTQGWSVQLFGVRSQHGGETGDLVLLRTLFGLRTAA